MGFWRQDGRFCATMRYKKIKDFPDKSFQSAKSVDSLKKSGIYHETSHPFIKCLFCVDAGITN